jgi:hypothetical protein
MALVSSGSNGSNCAFQKPGEAYRSHVFFADGRASARRYNRKTCIGVGGSFRGKILGRWGRSDGSSEYPRRLRECWIEATPWCLVLTVNCSSTRDCYKD